MESIEIRLRTQIIFYKECTQFLRVTLDSRLNWEEHIDRVTAKANRDINTIKVVTGKNVGRKPEIPERLYSRSKIDYGCQLYSTASPGTLKNSITYKEKV